MMITTKTTISFSIPDEYILAQKFSAQHPDWSKTVMSQWVGYTRQETFTVDLEEGEQE